MQELYFFALSLLSKLNNNVVRSYCTALAAATHALNSSRQFLAGTSKSCQSFVSVNEFYEVIGLDKFYIFP